MGAHRYRHRCVRVCNRPIRHRFAIQDLTLVLAVVIVATFVAFEIDIYANENSVTRREETIELDEVLTLGGILCIGLLVFSARRYLEQKQETRRRIAADGEIDHPRPVGDGVLHPRRRVGVGELAARVVSPDREDRGCRDSRPTRRRSPTRSEEP